MKSWITKIAAGAFALAALSLSACKKDETRTVLTPNAAPTLKASTTTPNLVLTTANSNQTAVTFTYTAADFGYQGAVTYTLQFDKKGGTFASPVTYSGGTAAGATSLTAAQLVNIFTNLGIAFNTSAQVDVRIIASVGSVVASQNSGVVTITGTPVPLCIANTVGNWGIVGPAANGWPPNAPASQTDRMMTYDCYSQTFSLRTTLTAGDLKFRANQDWGLSLGSTGTTFTTGVALSTTAGNLTITTPGTYTVTLAVTTDASGAVNGGTATIKP